MTSVIFLNRQGTDGQQSNCPLCRTDLDREQVSQPFEFCMHGTDMIEIIKVA